jgi:hypothetical protein
MVLCEDKTVVEEILSSISSSLSLACSSTSYHEIDLVQFILAGHEKFQLINLPKLWLETMHPSTAPLPPSPPPSSSSSSVASSEQIQEIIDEKERSFHQSIYQDFSLIFLEFLSNLLSQLTDLIPSPPVAPAAPTLVQGIKLLLCEDTELLDRCIETIEHWDFISRLKIEKASPPSSSSPPSTSSSSSQRRKIVLNNFQKEFIKLSLQLTSHLFYLNPFTQVTNSTLFSISFPTSIKSDRFLL